MSNMRYIIAAAASVPTELAALAPLISGGFFERSHLLSQPSTGPGLVPLTDIELNSIAKVPELFNFVDVTIVLDLPGGTESPVFYAAAARTGIPVQHWPEMEAGLKKAATVEQRTRDVSPWASSVKPFVQSGPTPDPADEDGQAEV